MTEEHQRPKIRKQEGAYPVSESLKILEGHDIYRSDNLIVALVAVDGQYGRDLRLYRWLKKKDEWKVDLCRMSVARWQWDSLASKVKELVQKYEIGRKKAPGDVVN